MNNSELTLDSNQIEWKAFDICLFDAFFSRYACCIRRYSVFLRKSFFLCFECNQLITHKSFNQLLMRHLWKIFPNCVFSSSFVSLFCFLVPHHPWLLQFVLLEELVIQSFIFYRLRNRRALSSSSFICAFKIDNLESCVGRDIRSKNFPLCVCVLFLCVFCSFVFCYFDVFQSFNSDDLIRLMKSRAFV